MASSFTRLACMASFFIDTGRDFKECYFCLGDLHYARPGNGGPQDPNEWKYGILLAAEEVVRAGVLS